MKLSAVSAKKFILLFRRSVGKIFCICFILKELQNFVFSTGTVSTLSRNKQFMGLNVPPELMKDYRQRTADYRRMKNEKWRMSTLNTRAFWKGAGDRRQPGWVVGWVVPERPKSIIRFSSFFYVSEC